MKTARQSLGRWGEARAAEYLASCDYTILERNVRTPYGEIDLVARQDAPVASVVFVEVKTRSSESFGFPEDSITPQKQAHLIAAAQAYLQKHPEMEDDWRIDVISIQRAPDGGEPTIIHFENALSP